MCLAGVKKKEGANRVWGEVAPRLGQTRCGDGENAVAGVEVGALGFGGEVGGSAGVGVGFDVAEEEVDVVNVVDTFA